MGFLDAVFKRNSELGYIFDADLIPDMSKRIHMKRLAIEICISFLGRTISQTEFRVKNGKTYDKDELYYRLNVRPNKNMTASTFWHTVAHKLVWDNEVLIVKTDDDDLVIADDFEHNEYAVFEDTFSRVIVKDYEFKRTFMQSEVLHFRYRNEKLAPLIDGLFADYGDLFGRLVAAQKRKGQLRATVDMDMMAAKSEKHLAKLQEFIDNMYKAINEKDVAIIPQQPGFTYKESSAGGNSGQNVDEINKVTNGFLDQVAMAIGIPISLIYGQMADVEKPTKNFLMFTVDPLLKKFCDECNAKFISKQDYLGGKKVEAKSVSYLTLFDLAESIDKLISSSVFTGNEIRVKLGEEPSDDPNLNVHYITKNYDKTDADKGGETE